MNGAGTGVHLFRLLLDLMVILELILRNVFYGVAFGMPVTASAGLFSVTTANRANAKITMASAWFAPPTSVG